MRNIFWRRRNKVKPNNSSENENCLSPDRSCCARAASWTSGSAVPTTRPATAWAHTRSGIYILEEKNTPSFREFFTVVRYFYYSLLNIMNKTSSKLRGWWKWPKYIPLLDCFGGCESNPARVVPGRGGGGRYGLYPAPRLPLLSGCIGALHPLLRRGLALTPLPPGKLDHKLITPRQYFGVNTLPKKIKDRRSKCLTFFVLPYILKPKNLPFFLNTILLSKTNPSTRLSPGLKVLVQVETVNSLFCALGLDMCIMGTNQGRDNHEFTMLKQTIKHGRKSLVPQKYNLRPNLKEIRTGL